MNNTNPTELKCECGASVFNIFKKSDCSTCSHNGAYDETADNGNGEYVWGDMMLKG